MAEESKETFGIDRESLRSAQWRKVQAILSKLESTSGFYARKFREAGVTASAVSDFNEFTAQVPFTTKAELLADRLAHPPFGSNLTQPLERYTRFCQTSGTATGQPMAWLDTPESYETMLWCWRRVYEGASLIKGQERLFFAFTFGPFLGFWTAFEAAAGDYLIIPGGGLSSQARLEMMARYGATVLCCTPTYAMRLGEMIGAASGVERNALSVTKLIVAGEPGGSVPAVRARLEALWNARVFDHHGMSEVGPVSYEVPDLPRCLVVIEEAYFAEVVNPETGSEVADGQYGELVLTTLDRTACPLLRYRSGDWVRKRIEGGRLVLEGGVQSRVDDMVVVRGVNVYPSAIESVVRQFPQVTEFMVEQRKVDEMDDIEVLIELIDEAAAMDLPKRLEARLRDTFSLRIPVTLVEPNSLPRHEFKAKRWRKV